MNNNTQSKHKEGHKLTKKLADSDKEIDIVKVNVMWYFISDYLDLLNNTGAVCDEDFMRYFKQLVDYVYSKLNIPNYSDILEQYVVFEVTQ